MRTIQRTLLGGCCVVAACSGHGDREPRTEPITPVTRDAVYVVNGGDATVSIIDAADSSLLGTIRLRDAAFPHHLYMSGDGASMYLAIPGADLSAGHGGNHGGGHGGGHDAPSAYVLRLDTADGATKAIARLDEMNHNAIPAPDGRTVWTSQMTASGRVLFLDAVTLEVTGEVAVESLPAEITFAPDGSAAFVANGGSDSVSVIDPTSRQVTATVPVGDNPVGAWPGRDGLLYVDNETGRSISVVDPSRRAVTVTYPLTFTPAFATTVGSELWVSDVDGGRVVFFDRITGAERGEVRTGAGAHAIALSPDGARAWVTNQGANTVSVIDVATHTVVVSVPVGVAPNGIAYRDVR